MKRLGLALIVLGGALAVWPAVGYVGEVAAIDACLDAGGSFDYTRSRCDHVESHAFNAYSDRHPMLWWVVAASGMSLAAGTVLLFSLPRQRNR